MTAREHRGPSPILCVLAALVTGAWGAEPPPAAPSTNPLVIPFEFRRGHVKGPDVNGTRMDRAARDLRIGDAHAGAGGEENHAAKDEERVFHR